VCVTDANCGQDAGRDAGGGGSGGSSSGSGGSGGGPTFDGSVGNPRDAASEASTPPPASDEGDDCSCRTAGQERRGLPSHGLLVASALALLALRRRRITRAAWGASQHSR
jgi:MYXO-CTERM domain-containing protein